MKLQEFIYQHVMESVSARRYKEDKCIEYLTDVIDQLDDLKEDVQKQKDIFIRNKKLNAMRRRVKNMQNKIDELS